MRCRLLLVASLAFTVATGCMGRVAPLSAQKGSTVLIPLGAHEVLAGQVGYGGSDVADPQRGELVWSLETSTGPVELTTRASGVAAMHTTAPWADGGSALTAQVVSLVDLENQVDDIPVGTYDLSVVHRYQDPVTSQMVEDPLNYFGELSVLPEQIEVIRDDATMETITGAPTTFEWLVDAMGSSVPLTQQQLDGATPAPVVVVSLGQDVWAAEVDVSYPGGVIEIESAVHAMNPVANHGALVHVSDDPGAQQTRVSAVASSGALGRLWIRFSLDDPQAAILDPADITVQVVDAWDENGAPMSASASVEGIY